MQKIANEFISEAAASEVASAGLNTIREICTRQPMAMSDTLLQDLVMYRKSKDKGVVMAAKGLLGLYREVGAEMLKKRDRGKTAAMGLRSGEQKERRFGEEEAGGIEGLELLEQWKEDERRRKREEKGLPPDGADDDGVEREEEEEEDWGAWDVEDDNSDSSTGWINVESDDEIHISDDDSPILKKAKQEAANPPATDDDTPAPSTDGAPAASTRPSTLATTRILTPADLAKLQELKLSADINSKLTGTKKRKALEKYCPPSNQPLSISVLCILTVSSHHPDDPLTAERISTLASLSFHSATKEAKLALAAQGKPERNEHRSHQSRRQEEKEAQGKSSTNREKARKKNFMMTLGKARGKQKRSLRQQGKVLRGHIERRKRGGKRGNVGQ